MVPEPRVSGEPSAPCEALCRQAVACFDRAPSAFGAEDAAVICKGWCAEANTEAWPDCAGMDACDEFRRCFTGAVQRPVWDPLAAKLGPYHLNVPKISPGELRVGEARNMLVRTQVREGGQVPLTLLLYRLDGAQRPLGPPLGQLFDDGVAPDNRAGDGTFTGLLPVAVQQHGHLELMVVGEGVDGPYYGPPVGIEVWPHWIPEGRGPNLKDRERIVVDETTWLLRGIVQVRFKDGVSYDEIEALLDGTKYAVLRYRATLRIFTLDVPDTDGSGVRAAVTALEAMEQVEWAQPETIHKVLYPD